MSILIFLLMLLIFGFGAFSPAPEAGRVEALDPADASVRLVTMDPVPLTIESEPATSLVIEPIGGEATYAVAGPTLYRADPDGGWTATGTSANLETIVADSRNPDGLWAGAGQECYRGGGVSLPLMRSVDAGMTWTEAGPVGYVPLAAWDPGDIVLAHDCSGLQVSRDGGATWTMPEGLPLGSQVTAFAIEASPESAAGLRVLVGVTGEGGTSYLYRVGFSSPGGSVDGPLATWWGHAPIEVADDGAILVGAPQGVLRSDDGGEAWETLRTGLESTTLEQDPLDVFPPDLEPNSFGLTSLAIVGEDIYVAGVDGIYRLAGATWEKIAGLDTEVTAMAIGPSGVLLMQTSEGSVLSVELHAHAM